MKKMRRQRGGGAARYLVVHSSTAKGSARAEEDAAVVQEQEQEPSTAVCALCHDPWEVRSCTDLACTCVTSSRTHAQCNPSTTGNCHESIT